MASQTPRIISLDDYRPSPFLIDSVDLRIELHPTRTLVRSRLAMRRNPVSSSIDQHCHLNGIDLELLEISLDGIALEDDLYRVNESGLCLPEVPDSFLLETLVRINPSANLALEGLYLSGGNFCTQCEAEGFRHITWFLDRPDVLSRYSTTLIADASEFPVLLSNGNRVDSARLDDGRHMARWEDPHPKPSYLFALVAGDLCCLSDRFVTASGRQVAIEFYVQQRNRRKVDYAIGALKRAMTWDEQQYGREYDLDSYMVVAVDDFNMGAMENKGLNIFNSKYVLASGDTATDVDYQNVEGVIGHEYFHNWTGNRITCRDWFQLSLKEGLTVFRDQEFSADMAARALKRIEDVRVLREHQFPEDSGPMAHPVRPQSYEEINNFYTVTIYNKGAEVVRMLFNLLGAQGYRKGMDLYFERFDGQAVTIDDFLSVMAQSSGRNLEQFHLWYEQAGTPRVQVEDYFDPACGTYRLSLTQSCPATPDQPEKAPFHIPLRMALLGGGGNPCLLRQEGQGEARERVLELREETEQFEFTGLAERPVLSLLRGFSAPVILQHQVRAEDLAFRMVHDDDSFNRWDAGQSLGLEVLRGDLEQRSSVRTTELLIDAFGKILSKNGDAGLDAAVLTLPSEGYLSEQLELIDPESVHRHRQSLRRLLGSEHGALLLEVYVRLACRSPYQPTAEAMGRRSLRNLCLSYLCACDSKQGESLAMEQFRESDNMTDTIAALASLLETGSSRAPEALSAFYHRWQNDPLVVDKWLSLQAASSTPGALSRVRELMEHPCYNPDNPNRVRALVGAFCQGNPAQFHAAGGEGYSFLAQQILFFDPRNPQLAARLVAPLIRWRRYEPKRSALMRQSLELIAARGELSVGLSELLRKSLAGG